MKSEERHRLQETELHKLGRQARGYWEDFAKDYAKTVLIGVAVVCLIAVIGIGWFLTTSATKDEQWTAMLAADSAEDFADVANKFPNQPVGQWARLKEAEQSLRSGIELAPVDREGSVSELKEAYEAFTQLSETQSELIEERRLFGLARCLETLAGVDLGDSGANVEGVEKAVEAYQRFVDQFVDSIYRPYAEERIKALKTNRAQEFYAWFREQNPNPEDFERPEDGPPTGAPGSPGQLPPGHPEAPSTPPTGQPPTGTPPTGLPPTGQPPTGTPPTGLPPTGQPPTGTPPTGTPPLTPPTTPPADESAPPDGGPALNLPELDEDTPDSDEAPTPPPTDESDESEAETEEDPASPPSESEEENSTPE